MNWKITYMIVLLVLAVSPAYAQEHTDDNEDVRIDTSIYREQTTLFVYDADQLGDTPLEGTSIQIYGAPYRFSGSAHTKQDGMLGIGILPEGTYQLTIEGPNGPQSDAWQGRTVEFSVDDKERQPRIEVGLHRELVEEMDEIPVLERYITVVGESAPSTDVVNAANFAASMKHALGVEFEGRTTTQLQEEIGKLGPHELSDYLDESVIVRFAGDRYAIIGPDILIREIDSYLSADIGRFGATMSRGAVLQRWILPELDEQGFPIVQLDETQATLNSAPEEKSTCESCLKDGQCIPYGLRTKNGQPIYCDISGELLPQKAEGEACQNNYECLSNSCSNSACVDFARELREQKGILQSILGWLQALF